MTGGTHRATWPLRCTITGLATLIGSSLPGALLARSPSAGPASSPMIERIVVDDVVAFTVEFPAGWLKYPVCLSSAWIPEAGVP